MSLPVLSPPSVRPITMLARNTLFTGCFVTRGRTPAQEPPSKIRPTHPAWLRRKILLSNQFWKDLISKVCKYKRRHALPDWPQTSPLAISSHMSGASSPYAFVQGRHLFRESKRKQALLISFNEHNVLYILYVPYSTMLILYYTYYTIPCTIYTINKN